MTTHTDALFVLSALGVGVLILLAGHATTTAPALTAAVSAPTCSEDTVSGFTLRVENDRRSEAVVVVSTRSGGHPNPMFWATVPVPADDSVTRRLERPPDTAHHAAGVPVVVTLRASESRVDIQGRFGCDPPRWEPF
jgi:hypothetical protein